ncbi:MAG: ABC transporter ATP-binding protein [candidate division Zixibacteria bacterium]|nr:ABC transporter ATP-binding protein [candidate division Zixibacteria bacterium]
MAGLALNKISKTFGKNKVLDRISLELGDDELLVLLGPSGCGKSTLLRIIAGLEEADEGEVFIADKRVDKLRPRDREVALVFQNYSLYPHMTVEKNLAFPLKVAGVDKSEIKKRTLSVAEMLGLAERLDDKPAQLSGGQRQRVALGRAIVKKPSIFLLDEPLSNLDADLRVRMRQEIVKIQKELKVAMVHVTHDQEEALSMGDRIALLHAGRLQQLGTPEELYKKPVNLFTAEFVGQPKINIIEAGLEKGMLFPFGIGWTKNKKITDDGLGEGYLSGKVLLGLRPESIELAGDGPFPAKVLSCEYTGDSYTARLEFKEHILCVSNVRSPLTVGQTVKFSFELKELLFFDSNTGERINL